MCVGVCVRRQGRRRARVPACPSERVCVCMYRCACVCVCVCARAWVDSSHPFIYQPPYRACAPASHSRATWIRASVRAYVCAYVCACAHMCVRMYVDVYVYTRQNRFNKALTLYRGFVPYVCGVTKTKYDEKLRRKND